MSVHIEPTGLGRVTFHVAEVFDAADASTIHEALRSAGPNVAVTVDLHRVRQSEPLAVALLSRDIVAHRGRIVVLGMCRHERRLLEYFGLSEQDVATHVPARSPAGRTTDTQPDELSTQGGLP